MGFIDIFPALSNPRTTSGNKFYLPIQTIPYTQKDENWQKDCMDFFTTQWMTNSYRRREKIVNYKLVAGEFTPELYNALSTTYEGMDLGDMNKPVKHYPILNLPLKDLWGEETKRPFSFIVKGEDEENKNEYIRYKTTLLQHYVMSNIQNIVAQQLQSMGLSDPNDKQYQDTQNSMSPPDIENFMRRKYTTTIEKTGTVLLNKFNKQLLLKEKFQTGIKHASIVAEEYYWIGRLNDQLIVENINPVEIVYDKSDSVSYIDEADWVVRGVYMTKAHIIDRYKMYLTDEEVKTIENYDRNGGTTTNPNVSTVEQYTEYGYPYLMAAMNDSRYPISPDYRIFEFSPSSNQYAYNNLYGYRNHILVVHAEWMSRRLLNKITFLDNDGNPQVMILDGEFKLSKQQKEMGWESEEIWINEAWEGTKIGQNIYIKVQPKENQYRSMNRLYGTKLGYTGGVYNALNTKPVSIVDEMKPHQALYNIILDKLEEDFNSELGQLLLMDPNQIPTKQGWDLEKWLYWIKKMKIVMVDPTAEGKPATFNQFTSIDATLGQAIQTKIELLNLLEQKCWQQVGFNVQRLGQATQSETATATNAALNRSFNQTDDFFRTHDNIKARVLTNLLEEAKSLYADKTSEETFFLDDMSIGFLEIDGKKFTFSDLSVYITDSAKDQQALQALRQLAQPALQNGTPLADVAMILSEDSIAVIREKLEELKELNAQMAQQKMQQEQQVIQDKKDLEIEKLDREDANKEKDRQVELEIAEMKTLGQVEFQNPDSSDLIIQQAELQQKQLEHTNEVIDKEKQRQHEIKLKEKDIQSKKDTENKRTEAIKHQTDIQKQMADDQLAFKNKELNAKSKLEKLKIRKMSAKTDKNNKK